MRDIQSIYDIDFASLYRTHASLTLRRNKKQSDWDARAPRARKNGGTCSNSNYIRDFVAKMDLSAAKTLLDVGCGGGAISLSVAPKLQQVYSLDFSSKMLDVVTERAQQLNIHNNTNILRAWEDSWDDIPECDICVSSRSSMVADLEPALAKLNAKAKKAVYMTMTVDKDFIQRDILTAIGRDGIGFPTYIYAVNLLYQQGYQVSVDFLNTEPLINPMPVDDEKSFIDSVIWSIGDLNEHELERLKYYYQKNKDHLISGGNKNRTWAFLAWNPSQKR